MAGLPLAFSVPMVLAALALLVFIVWWTMFSGRHEDESDGDGPRR